MNAFSLAPFLASLESDGIRPTLHDYERISLALWAEAPWTVTRLRGVLSALLVKDEDGEAIFTRRFDQFFSLLPDAQANFSKLNVDGALADLLALAQGSIGSESTESSAIPLRRRTSRPHSVPTELVRGRTIRSQPPGDLPSTIETPHPTKDIAEAPAETETYIVEGLSPQLDTTLLGQQTSLNDSPTLPAVELEQDRPLIWNPDAPRHFRPGTIGGNLNHA